MLRPIIDTLHVLALSLWLGVVLASGAAAAVIFPTMKHLDPSLPAYAAYPHEHWKIAAGSVANRLFYMADIVQFATAFLATTTFAAALFFFPRAPRSWSLAIRAISLATALTAVAYLLLVLSPAMNLDFANFLAAARTADAVQADLHRAAFSAAHPKASAALTTTAAAVFLALVAAIWNISTRTTPPRTTTTSH